MKDDRLMAGPFTIGKCTYSLSRFVFKAGKHIIESLVAKSL